MNAARYECFKSLMKKTIRLPSPVAIPAIKEKRKAIKITLVSITPPAFSNLNVIQHA
jgi:hypothetical protein